MTWEKSGEFVESDVIEWIEAIWPPNLRRRRRKQKPWGKQKVTAQITAIDSELVKLTVLRSSITENIIGSELRPYKVGSIITKKHPSLVRCDAHRLHWSEEDVRKALMIGL